VFVPSTFDGLHCRPRRCCWYMAGAAMASA
jgi:hypothetical protein